MKKCIGIVLLLFAGVLALTGCSGSGQDDFQEKNYTVDGKQIEEIKIDVRDRQIRVSLSEDDRIHIGYQESEKEFYHIAVTEGNVLTMSTQNNKNWSDYIGGKPAASARVITLQIPDDMISALTLSTTNEDLRIPAIHMKDRISLTVNGGNIEFDGLDAGQEISLNAKNGDISGTILGRYEEYAIECNIKKGESNLPKQKEEGNKSLHVTNNNGDIAIEFKEE